jgi:hypothetical protein
MFQEIDVEFLTWSGFIIAIRWYRTYKSKTTLQMMNGGQLTTEILAFSPRQP